MGKTTDTRQRMVQSAAVLLREEGVHGASFPKVLKLADAPRGSLQHHFPGGKREMIADSVRWAGGLATTAMQRADANGATPREIVEGVVQNYRRVFEDSGSRAACPVGAVANESFDDDELRQAVADVFGDWRQTLSGAIERTGETRHRSEQLTDVAIAAIEGALMVARVDRSTIALDNVLTVLAELLPG